MSESHGVRPGETAALPATDPDEMKDAISSSSAQEPVADPVVGQPHAAGGSSDDQVDREPAGDNQDGDTQHGDTQHGDTQHGDTQHGDTQHGDTRDDDTQDGEGPARDDPVDTVDASSTEPDGAPAVEQDAEAAPEVEDEGPIESADEPGDTAADEPDASDDEPGDTEVEGEVVPPEPEEPTYQRFDCTGADFSAGADAARSAIERGECVVLPTDTVYGIGADAFSAEAVQRLLDAKERGRDMPPPVLISDTQMFKALAADIPQAALDLVERFWPGGLTVICTMHANLEVDLGDMEGTIALRVPDHALARDLLRQTGPLAVSSANLTGRPSALSVDEAIDMLGNAVSVYLDGGRLADPAGEDGAGGLPSTIVDFTHNEHGEVLRSGAISTEALQEVVPELIGPKTIKPLGTAAELTAAINALKAPEPAEADVSGEVDVSGEADEPGKAEMSGEADASETDEAGASAAEPVPADGSEPSAARVQHEPSASGEDRPEATADPPESHA